MNNNSNNTSSFNYEGGSPSNRYSYLSDDMNSLDVESHQDGIIDGEESGEQDTVNIKKNNKVCENCNYDESEYIRYCNNGYYCLSCIEDLCQDVPLSGFCTRNGCSFPSDDLDFYKGDLLCGYCCEYMYIQEDNFKDDNDELVVKEVQYSNKKLSSKELSKRVCLCCQKKSCKTLSYLFEISDSWLNTRISNQEYDYKDEDGVMQCYKYICVDCLYQTCLSCLKSDVGEILHTKYNPSERSGYGNYRGISCTRRCKDCWSDVPGLRGYCSLCKDYDYLDDIRFEGEFKKDENGNKILYCYDCMENEVEDDPSKLFELDVLENDYIPNKFNGEKCCSCGTCSGDESDFYKKACKLDIFNEWLWELEESRTEDLYSIMFRSPIEGSCQENGKKSLRHILGQIPYESIRHITSYLNSVDECVPNKFIRLTNLSWTTLREEEYQNVSIDYFLFSALEDDLDKSHYSSYFVCWQCFMSTLFLYDEHLKTVSLLEGFMPRRLLGGRIALPQFFCLGLLTGSNPNYRIDYSSDNRIKALERNKEKVLKLNYPNTYRTCFSSGYIFDETYDNDRKLTGISIKMLT
tara:strand:- start:351 stop:2081 length:1731 start_codon:yes stop_codon:yes gene_type:complete